MSSAASTSTAAAAPSGPFKIKSKGLNRPTTWFVPAKSLPSSTPSSSSSSSTSTFTAHVPRATLGASPGNPFAVTFGLGKGKHKLSPSPSPNRAPNGLAPADEDFVMISPVKPSPTAASILIDEASSSPFEDSPTPACGVASATARLRLADTDDSPIRRPAGQSRSLAAGEGERGRGPPSPLKLSTTIYDPMLPDTGSPGLPDTPLMSDRPIPQPLFPLRASQSAEHRPSSSKQMIFAPSKAVRIDESRIPRLSNSQPFRGSDRPTLGQKKAISLDQIPMTGEKDEAFGSVAAPLGHSRKSSRGNNGLGMRAHKRINSGEGVPAGGLGSMSRSTGHKSGLALTLSPATIPDFASNSSLSSLSTNHLTPPIGAFSPSEPTLFEDVKPLQEVFEQNNTTTLHHKFKPRDSGVGGIDEDKPVPPPSTLKLPPQLVRPKRPAMLKRTSSMGAERPACETPTLGVHPSWPAQAPFQFLGNDGMGLGMVKEGGVPSMPGTPVKKTNFASHGAAPPTISHSHSQPTLSSSDHFSSPSKQEPLAPPKWTVPPSTTKKVVPGMAMAMSSPESPVDGMGGDHSSPSVRAGRVSLGVLGTNGRLPTRMDSGSESEGTPTKGRGDRTSLGVYRPEVQDTPSKSTNIAPTPLRSASGASTNPNSILPRLSLPAFAAPKLHRTLHHRQSHPANSHAPEEDVFERKFITLDTLGKGAFSVVVKVQERYGEGLYAVKKARAVFDGVKDRLRHLEEVDILRHLSKTPCTHVIKFVDAWEQNRQLFIQTELCLGTLAFFLEEYGRVVERLDEGRVWKIVRELSDGINHIHSNGVIHFDIKPANILIDSVGQLKIGDFGLATRWPRISPAEILRGSGLGAGTAPSTAQLPGGQGKIEREGDRVYMAPEMLQGMFVMAADIFSFGLVILEVSTNICVPDGGPAWHALREDDFSIVDLSPLSPMLVHLIHSCMASAPTMRPTIQDISNHPVVTRARMGKEALAPEAKGWVVDVLGGGFGVAPVATPTAIWGGDVEMGDA